MDQSAQARQWLWRGSGLAALLVLELLVTTISFDTRDLLRKPGVFTAFLEKWAPGILQGSVVFVLAYSGILYLRHRDSVLEILRQHAGAPFRLSWLLAHGIFYLGAFTAAHQFFTAKPVVQWPPDLLGLLCLMLGLAGLLLACGAFAPLQLIREIASASRGAWLVAALAAVLSGFSGLLVQRLWAPATKLTFVMVQGLLHLVSLPIVADPASALIGTQRFSVIIAKQCSGLEGAGLFLIFGALGLFLFRADFRFPRALWLIPIGIGILYCFNAVRIAMLIWIGHSGAPDVASGGFHSQAGWIFFNVVSLGVFAWARSSSWFGANRTLPGAHERDSSTDPSPYLLPFLAILATGMVTKALAGSFEWLYPLKPVVAGLILWHYRGYYRRVLDWRFGWTGAVAGTVVFVIWVTPDVWGSPTVESGMPQPLAAVAPLARWAWILARAAGAVLTVPVAEELAFRGFLMRRLVSTDVDSVVPAKFHWPGMVVSSIAFGLLHGDRWLVGIFAGVIYGLTLTKTGRIGEAAFAHAVTNLLLVLMVLFFGTWRYW